MSIWIVREKTGTLRNGYYGSFQGKPRHSINSYGDVNFYSNNGGNSYSLGTYCPEVFERISNIHLEPGEMVRIKSIEFTI